MAWCGGSPWRRLYGSLKMAGPATEGQELGWPTRPAVPCPWGAPGPAKQKGTWPEWAVGGGTMKMEEIGEAAVLTGEILR
jgi:hypothetical protein